MLFRQTSLTFATGVVKGPKTGRFPGLTGKFFTTEPARGPAWVAKSKSSVLLGGASSGSSHPSVVSHKSLVLGCSKNAPGQGVRTEHTRSGL